VHRVTHLSNYSPEMAPPGMSSFLAEMTYRGGHLVGEDDARAVVDELHACGMLDRATVCTLDWSQAEHAYILHDLDFTRNLKTVLGYLDGEGLHTLGRFGRCEYLNVDMCLRAAIDFASRQLGREVSPSELA
jgi:protoporphyrinogen oxidase